MILHIDLNSFFARAEQQADHRLRGQPIGVLGKGHKGARTCVVAASPEAKKPWGVKSGMSVDEAQALCPGIILVPPNYDRYLDISRRFIAILDRFSPWVEIFSIDEAFLALRRQQGTNSGEQKIDNAEALNVAQKIKYALKHELGELITASIGVAWGKIFAKLASELKKPDGLIVLEQTNWLEQVGALPVTELCGIAQRLGRSLEILGIRTIADLAAADAGLLTSRFGPSLGMRLAQIGQGIDRSPVVSHRDLTVTKSIGHQLTLDWIAPFDSLWPTIAKLVSKVGRRLRRANLRAGKLHIHVKLTHHRDWSHHLRLGGANTDQTLLSAAKRIVNQFPFSPRLGAIRIGVVATNLMPDNGVQPLSLFPGHKQERTASSIIDALRDRFGEEVINWASTHNIVMGNLRDWRGSRAVLGI